MSGSADYSGVIMAMILGPPLMYLAFNLLCAVLGGALQAPVMLWRSLARFRHLPLETRHQIRAGMGAFGLVIALGLWARGWPINSYVVPGLAGVSGLYLVGGVVCARRPLTFDPFSVLWFGVGIVACAALVIVAKEVTWLSWWS
ncbi:MAG: hypothetical protein JOZ32_17940 [Bryobacterales bacterium]|nr:hypothetical protein [Bryobacterales bacterium]